MKALLALLLLAAAAYAAPVLQWDPNTEPDIVGYFLKWGFAPAAEDHIIPTGLATIWDVDEPFPPGATVYFVVSAKNMYGMESGPSNEVMYVVPTPTPTPTPVPTPTPAPSPPKNLRIKLTLTFHMLYMPGSMVKILAPNPPPGFKFARWDGDRVILSNFLDRWTTATIPYQDVSLEGVYE